MSKKRGIQVVIFGILFLFFIAFFLKYTANFFEPLLYNNPSLAINEWDLLQIIFGYYTTDTQQSLSYLDLKNMTQLMTPICIQLIGILFSIYFLRIPLSFHLFVKSRSQKKKTYYFFFLKKTFLLTFLFVFILFLSILSLFKLSSFDLTTSSFNYQNGSLYLSIILYLVSLFLMITAFSLFIFYSYIKGRGLLGIGMTIFTLVLLNIFDRVFTSVNLILFDNQHWYMDSLATWGIFILILSLILKRTKLYQEDYND